MRCMCKIWKVEVYQLALSSEGWHTRHCYELAHAVADLPVHLKAWATPRHTIPLTCTEFLPLASPSPEPARGQIPGTGHHLLSVCPSWRQVPVCPGEFQLSLTHWIWATFTLSSFLSRFSSRLSALTDLQ